MRSEYHTLSAFVILWLIENEQTVQDIYIYKMLGIY